jgi:hypothetical protein
MQLGYASYAVTYPGNYPPVRASSISAPCKPET